MIMGAMGAMQLIGKGVGLKIDESSLTGEFMAVSCASGDQVRLEQSTPSIYANADVSILSAYCQHTVQYR